MQLRTVTRTIETKVVELTGSDIAMALSQYYGSRIPSASEMVLKVGDELFDLEDGVEISWTVDSEEDDEVEDLGY